MRDLFGEERVQEGVVGPLLLFRSLTEIAPDATGVGEVKALEQRLEVGAHRAPPFDSARTSGSASCAASWPGGCAPRALEMERALSTAATVSLLD